MAPLSSPTFKNTQHQEAGKQNVPSMLSQQIIQKERFFTSKIQQLNEMDKEFDFRKSASEGTAVSKSSDCRSGIVDKCQRYACSDKTLQAMINNKLTKKRCENEHNWEVKQRAEARLHESLCRLLGLPKVTIHLRLELGPEHTIKLMERVESELLAVREDMGEDELRTYHDKGVGRMIVEKLAKERDENKHHWAAVQRADALIREGICRIYELPTGLITLPLAIPAEKKMELLSRIESKEPALQKNADKNKTSQAAEGRDKMMPEADGLVSDDDIIWEDEA
ncbi:hypothetical protein HDK77DRAFT_495773 [Phyllosticta capitalensis]